MTIINIIHGDLIQLAKSGSYDLIIHGCNCFETMGSGIAPQIANAFEGVREADLAHSFSGDVNKLGDYSAAEAIVDGGKSMAIINAYTQYSFGEGKQVEYLAIRSVFTRLNNIALVGRLAGTFDNDLLMGLPQIGAGLAGGEWDIIEDIINDVTPDLPIELVMYKPVTH